MLEIMTQAQMAHNHDIDMMVKSLPSHRLTISDVIKHSVRAKESCCFGNQDSVGPKAYHPSFDDDQLMKLCLLMILCLN